MLIAHIDTQIPDTHIRKYITTNRIDLFHEKAVTHVFLTPIIMMNMISFDIFVYFYCEIFIFWETPG